MRADTTECKVFVPHNGGHDYTPAEKFGEVVIVSNGVVRTFDTERFYHHVAQTMRTMAEHDYIAVHGLPLANALCSAIQARRFGRLNVLLYRGGSYLERSLRVT